MLSIVALVLGEIEKAYSTLYVLSIKLKILDRIHGRYVNTEKEIVTGHFGGKIRIQCNMDQWWSHYIYFLNYF